VSFIFFSRPDAKTQGDLGQNKRASKSIQFSFSSHTNDKTRQFIDNVIVVVRAAVFVMQDDQWDDDYCCHHGDENQH
jgi:hypothetical protein